MSLKGGRARSTEYRRHVFLVLVPACILILLCVLCTPYSVIRTDMYSPCLANQAEVPRAGWICLRAPSTDTSDDPPAAPT